MPMLRTISCVEGRSQSVAKAAACPVFSLILNRSLMSPGKNEKPFSGTTCTHISQPPVTSLSSDMKVTANQTVFGNNYGDIHP